MPPTVNRSDPFASENTTLEVVVELMLPSKVTYHAWPEGNPVSENVTR